MAWKVAVGAGQKMATPRKFSCLQRLSNFYTAVYASTILPEHGINATFV